MIKSDSVTSYADDEVDPRLERHMLFQAAMAALCEGVETDRADKRELTIASLSNAARDLAQGQWLLITEDNPLPAYALVRPMFEYVVKAIWCRVYAKDDWLTRLWTPPEVDVIKETAPQRMLKEMLDNIAQHPPTAQIHQKLVALYEATGKVMHSFVHGGIYANVHALIDIPMEQQLNLLRNSNGLLLLNAQTLLLPYEGWRDDYRAIQSDFQDVLPPFDPVH